MRRILPTIGVGLALLMAATPAPTHTTDDAQHGVYVRLVEGIDGTVTEATDHLVEALEGAGWQILAVHATGMPAGCPYEARVVVVHSPGYAATIQPYGNHVAFAVPIRMVVFEDEGGVHVGGINLLSLNRTIVDEQVPASAWLPWQNRLGSTITSAFADHAVSTEYGQFRDVGRISRTFGIMAGGPFVEKIEAVMSVPAEGTSVAEVAARLHDGFGAVGDPGDWQLEPIYLVDLPEMQSAVIGVSGGPMEVKAFSIVGSGTDDSRDDYTCPGIDHAAAFPVELVVTRVDDRIEVRIVDEMFRMKMFFEDAGKVAFAKNMGMPGSIENEIRRKVEAALGS